MRNPILGQLHVRSVRVCSSIHLASKGATTRPMPPESGVGWPYTSRGTQRVYLLDRQHLHFGLHCQQRQTVSFFRSKSCHSNTRSYISFTVETHWHKVKPSRWCFMRPLSWGLAEGWMLVNRTRLPLEIWKVLAKSTDCTVADNDPEVKKESQVFSANIEVGVTTIKKLFGRFSSLYRLKKFVAWILRYRTNLRRAVQ